MTAVSIILNVADIELPSSMDFLVRKSSSRPCQSNQTQACINRGTKARQRKRMDLEIGGYYKTLHTGLLKNLILSE